MPVHKILPAALFILPVALAAQPTISGTVSNAATGGPVVAVDLDVFDTAGARVPVTGALTASDGTYTITLPGPGDYIIRADMATGAPLADQYYPGVFLPSQATPISLPADSSEVTGIDFSLQPGFFITGRVTGNGASPGMTDLDLYAANGEFLGGYPASTASDGSYTIGALPPGDYYLKAEPDPHQAEFFIQRFYGNALLIADAAPISLTNATVSGINWDLPEGGKISGTVRAEDGTLLVDIDFDIYDDAGNRLPYNTDSLPDGTYQIGPMPAGSYVLRADPDATQGYVRAYYGNGLEQNMAVPVTVAVNNITTGIDFSLMLGGTISGLITGPSGSPVAGMDLDVFEANGSRVSLTTKSDGNGQYLVGALPTGNYTLRADPVYDAGLTGQYFGGDSAPSSAVPISVVAGADTGSINFQLAPGGWIEGAIRNTSGTAVPDIDLDVFDAAGTRLYPTALSGLDGRYAVGPLPVGPVILRADPSETQGVAERYHPNANDIVDTIPINITPAAPTAGVDFSLPFAGWITGTIRDLSGTPLTGMDIDVFDAAGNRISLNAITDFTGSYIIGPVPTGEVILRADPTETQGYARRYFPDGRIIGAAGIITVEAATESSGIDISLPPAGWISGTVFNASNQPLEGIDIVLYDSLTDRRLFRADISSIDGSYVVGPLEYGSYNLQAVPQPAQPYAMEYFQEASFIDQASPIGISSQSGRTGADFTLVDGKAVSGVVTLSNGQPAVGIDMDILVAGSGLRLEQNATTDATGAYAFPQVPFGSYIVRADPLDTTPYLDTYFVRTAFEASATPVSVNTTSATDSIDIQLLDYQAPVFSRNNATDSFALLNETTATVTFSINAPSGDVTAMRFYREGRRVFTDSTAPFGFGFADVPTGTYALTPSVLDVFGRETFGSPLVVVNPSETPTLGNPLYVALPDASGRLLLAWRSLEGQTYRIESAATLEGPWSLLQTTSGTGEMLTLIQDAPAGKARYLRLILLP